MLFYFDLYDGTWSHKDEHGDHLQTIYEAEDMAAALVVDLIREAELTSASRTFACEVRVDDGAVVHRVELAFRSTISEVRNRPDVFGDGLSGL